MRTVTLPNQALLSEVVKLLSEHRQVTIKAKGNSMMPFIVGGEDSVILQKELTYGVGDIVLAEVTPGSFVLHRILKIDAKEVVLMGDGNVTGVEKCSLDAIHGRAIGIIRRGKQLDCTRRSHRLKARVWKALLPIRRYLLAIYRRIR